MPALLPLEPTPLASLLPLQLLLAFVLCQIPVRDGVIVTVGTTQECGLHLSPGDLILVCALCGLLLSDMFRMLLHRKEKLRAAKKKMLNKSPTQSKKVEKEEPPFRNHLLKDE